jgi:diphthamide synthase (EF-2-diphthine--ammonia ligase)
MLHVLRGQGLRLAGLLTTFNEAFDRVSMHGTRREVVEAQAQAAGLELWPVPLPWPCPNEEYERRMAVVMVRAKAAGVTHVAFGDLFLPDIRRYREEKLASTGLRPLFPLWTTPQGTRGLAEEMIRAGLRARLASVDPHQLPADRVGREFDDAFLTGLPVGVDPCGENGEFHTVCHAGPMFASSIPLEAGEIVHRDGFWYADFRLRR